MGLPRKCVNRFGSPCKYPLGEDGWCWRHRDDPLQAAKRKKTAKPGSNGVIRIVRESDRWTQIERELQETGGTLEDFCKTLSVEELVRGRVRNKNGVLTNQEVKWIPKEMHTACVRELMRRGKELYHENYLAAIKTMVGIATDEEVDPATRIRAAAYVIERIEGKVPDQVVLSTQQPWEAMVAGVVAEVNEEQAMSRAEELLSGQHSPNGHTP